MLSDTTKPSRRARIIAPFAMVLAFVGGLWWFNTANGATEAPTVVATSCSGFKADAQKLFDKGDTAVLSGTFAPGDRVRLAVDFKGIGHAWELTGVLANAKKTDVTGRASFETYTRAVADSPSSPSIIAEARGDISGFGRLDLEIDVAKAGEGAITIKKTSSVPSLILPRVARARCSAS
jgi:hypothetical protein